MSRKTKEIERKSRHRVFMTVSAGVFMSTMDSSMVNVALPELMRTFQSSLALVEWVVLIYLLTITSLLIFWGRLCSRWGCGPVYSNGMLLFAIGSLLCSLSQSIWFLIGSRFIQALGASMMMATGPALIRMVFQRERLGRGLGLIGIATSFGLMTGPALSGILLRWLHWRAIFWVTVPIGLLFYLLSRKILADYSAGQNFAQLGSEKNTRIDLPGAFFWSVLVSLTLLLLSHATILCCGKNGLASLLFAAGSVAMVSGWILFVLFERKRPSPFLPVRLFRQRFFSMAVLSSMLSFAVLFFVLILMPFYLDHILRLPADRIGYVMMALPLCVFIVSPVAGRLHDWIGARLVATFGLLCCLVSMLLLAGVTAGHSPLDIAFRLALLGFGQAMFLSPNSASALAGVEEDEVGVTAGMLATARNFGMLAGTGLAGLSFTLHFARITGGLDMQDFVPSLAPAFMAALSSSFQYAVFISLAAVIVSWMRGAPGSY